MAHPAGGHLGNQELGVPAGSQGAVGQTDLIVETTRRRHGLTCGLQHGAQQILGGGFAR